MRFKILSSFFLAAAAALAASGPVITAPSIIETGDSVKTGEIEDLVPASILTALATAAPASWYNDRMDLASRSSTPTTDAADTYPDWYNTLPTRVKAWAMDFNDKLANALTFLKPSQTEIADVSVVDTDTSIAIRQTSFDAVASKTPIAFVMDTNPSLSIQTAASNETFDIGGVPDSILTVLATGVPASWYNNLMDPASLSSIMSEASASVYPDWYNALPSSVKAWVTAHRIGQLGGDSVITHGSAKQSETVGESAVNTGTGTGTGTSLSQASFNGVQVTATSLTTSTPASETSSSSSSQSASISALYTHFSSEFTDGATAATRYVVMGVACAAGMLAIALAL
ncbi:hypothetical protein N7457_008988 [Penicillium paradoxum]|uniref:uncharacterized protein n=1 Tax=Penicillium paradoxum TaxID=176176 RepID=UPI0025488393|nr:uncharacterized protein N7457_008988 [Penicillium paradoxum]KAJ5774092.1 hypothetical protein N7457_008988 [Penicillium paradoxum]